MPKLLSREVYSILEDMRKEEEEDRDVRFDSDPSSEHTWCNKHQKIDCDCFLHRPREDEEYEDAD